ncbi:MAG: hypothetical protein QG597_2642 [Actinomycetota bacterium]|nr:hypothetical protein [Actinomycetota bacterium]
MAKLSAHAMRLSRAYLLDGAPVLGVSVFAALDDIGYASLEGILAGKLSSYRVVHLVKAGDLLEAGFRLLPTFGRPHMTVVLERMEQVGILLRLAGPAQANQQYGDMRNRRRR